MKVLISAFLVMLILVDQGSCAPVSTKTRQQNLVKCTNSIEPPKVISLEPSTTQRVPTSTVDSLEVEDFINPNCILSLCGG